MLISATNIHKYYGPLHVLKGITMEVQSGQLVSLVGASGAGKTTLLQILGTLEQPDKGTVNYDKQNVSGLGTKPLAAFRNKHIGFIFQFHHLLPEFTALENVCLPAMIGGRSLNQCMKKASELLEFLKLGDRIHHKPSQLSGGEQQRVAVARALINKPDVVLADEPSGNLDSANARELHNWFVALRDQFGQTFVIATHNEELAGMTDRKYVISDGMIEEFQGSET